MAYPDIIKLMGAGQADAANIPVLLAFLAEKNKAGKIIGTGADIEPNAQLACWVMSSNFLAKNKSAAVRFAMVHTYAGRLFNDAAAKKGRRRYQDHFRGDQSSGSADRTGSAALDLVRSGRMPNVESGFAQYKFLTEDIKLVSGKVTKEMLFDLSPATEAAARLKSKNPFG